MTRWTSAGVCVLVVAMAASGCARFSASSPTSPSSTGGASGTTGGSGGTATMTSLSASGTWTSAAAGSTGGLATIDPGTCGNFTWAITQWSLTSAAGTFAAQCGGGLSLAGNATATLASASSVNWGASGTVTGLASPCTFDVTGTAALESGGVRVTYTAKVCGVTISGSELLKKP